MPLNEEQRKQQATKAANVLAEMRRAAIKERDKDIRLAFRYLSKDEDLWGMERSAAFKVLLKPEYAGWHKSNDTTLRILADAHGLTRQAIRYILNKGNK